MKKLYSTILLAIIGMFAFGAYAQKVTIKTALPFSVYVMSFYDYNNYAFPEPGTTLELDTKGSGFQINANSGYKIVNVVNEEDEVVSSTGYVSSMVIEEGAVYIVNVVEKEPRTLVVKGNGKHLCIAYDDNTKYDEQDQVDGQWVINNVPDGKYINIKTTSDDYVMTSVKKNGSEENSIYGPQFSYQVSSGAYSGWDSGTLTLDIETLDLTEKRDKTVHVTVEGDPEVVQIQRMFTQTYFVPEKEQSSFDLAFCDEDSPLQIGHVTYGNTLYQVILDGEKVEADKDYYFYVKPNDNSNITIKVDYPDKDVDVAFSYINEKMKGCINNVRVNNILQNDFDGEKITAKLGDKVSVNFNESDYTFSTLTVNGDDVTTSWGDYVFTLTKESGYTFVIDGTAKEPYKLKVTCADWDKVYLVAGYEYPSDPIFKLTGVETDLEIPQSINNGYLNVKMLDNDYALENITVVNGDVTKDYYYTNRVKITGDGEIEITLKKMNRDLEMVFWLDPEVEWSENNTFLTLGVYQDYQCQVDLNPGYNHVKFGEFDNEGKYSRGINVTFNRANYGDIYYYKNGEFLASPYMYKTELAEGDVFKAFGDTPAEHTVKYEIAEGTPVSVLHDHITAIETPDTHTVHAGTEIHLVPTAAADETPQSTKLVVKVNDEPIEANENGVYVATVKDDTNVKAFLDNSTGIDNIAVGGNANGKVYNLQGIEVLDDASQIKTLPAGIYVSGGKKIVVR